jgi:hypothetical protein
VRLSTGATLLLCLGAAALQIAAFYPGYVTHDSAYQWWQGRHDEITTLWPPGMALFLGLFDPNTGRAPAVFFVLHSVLFWGCAAYLAMRQPTFIRRASVALMFCVLPIASICLPHVWSDVALAIWLLLAALGLDFASRMKQRNFAQTFVLVTCSAILILSVLLRHNALFSLPPLLWLAACGWRSVLPARTRGSVTPHTARREFAVTALITGALLALTVATYTLVPRWVSKVKADTWAITLIWDLQALSVAAGKVLVPSSISNNATIEDLRASFDPINAVTMYMKSRSSWANATLGLSPDQKSDLTAAWMQAIVGDPMSYARHRIFVFTKMLGPKRDPAIDGSADDPIHVQFRDNPPLTFANSAALRGAQAWVNWLKPQWWASPFAWMIAAGLCFGWVLLRSPREARSVWSLGGSPYFSATCLWLSGLLYLIPLLVIAPTADLRYALWPVLASVAAACLALSRDAIDGR